MRTTAKAILPAFALILAAGVGSARADEYADVRKTLEGCFDCHGPNGASTQPLYPILAGQHLNYLYIQLKDFKAGRRADPVMNKKVKGLSKDQMLKIAQFFSEQTWPDIAYEADPALVAKGKTAAAAGQCVQCHLGGYEGTSGVPRAGGQYRGYLEKTMMDFKTGARANNAAKSALMESYEAADIAAMAEFMARL
jgi:cytochrome c553